MENLKDTLISYFDEKIQTIEALEVTYKTFKRVVKLSKSDEEAKNNLKKEFKIFNVGNTKFEDEFNEFIKQIEAGYTPALPKLQINESKIMKIQINEVRRMQQLAGIITENQLNENLEDNTITVDDAREYAISFEDEDITSDFDKTFFGKENISKQEFMDFYEQYIDDMSEIKYLQAAWRKLSSGEGLY